MLGLETQLKLAVLVPAGVSKELAGTSRLYVTYDELTDGQAPVFFLQTNEALDVPSMIHNCILARINLIDGKQGDTTFFESELANLGDGGYFVAAISARLGGCLAFTLGFGAQLNAIFLVLDITIKVSFACENLQIVQLFIIPIQLGDEGAGGALLLLCKGLGIDVLPIRLCFL